MHRKRAVSIYTMGVDIGSSTSKCVILRGGETICAAAVLPGGAGTSAPERVVEAALSEAGAALDDIESIAATGYGRNTLSIAGKTFSELSCHARGASFMLPGVRTVIDVGGQDCKVMQLDGNGRLDSFSMNDKCAAGTGRFMEVMSRILEIELPEMAQYSGQAERIIEITSTCAVFAESEIISQLSKGADKRALVAGIHRSVAVKAASLAKRMLVAAPVFFSGGVSKNAGIVSALEHELGIEVKTDDRAQLAGALGAALLITR